MMEFSRVTIVLSSQTSSFLKWGNRQKKAQFKRDKASNSIDVQTTLLVPIYIQY